MEYSRSEIMTVREMIDAAIVFDEDEPVVNFKLLESILYIIGRQLNVLERSVMMERAKLQKYKINLKKNTVAISEIKVHKKIGKKTKEPTSTESTTGLSSAFKTQHKRRSSRKRSRSKSKDAGRYRESTDDERSKKRQRDSKRHGRHRDSDEGGRRHGPKFRDDSRDVLHEKLLVVSRSSLEAMHERDERSAVVTQEQYDKILSEVRRLQDRFGIVSNIDTSWFNLHKPTSVTDPRAALNIAAKLNIAQKKVDQMLDIVTKFASAIPGFNIEAAFHDSLLRPLFKETPTSKYSSPVTEPEEVLLDECLLDYENLATWSEFQAVLDDIQKNVVNHMTTGAAEATETAKRASKLFKLAAPKLSEASILSDKFARCRILFDRFNNNATALDVKIASQRYIIKMAISDKTATSDETATSDKTWRPYYARCISMAYFQMGDCQENVSQLQFEVETMIERIDDVLAHPAEDPGAVAAINDEFAILQSDLTNANRDQYLLKEHHTRTALDLEIIRKRLELIRRIKTTREEALEHLKAKARVDDVNSFLSRDQLYAIVGFLQRKINHTHDVIDSGEVKWQHCIEDYITYLYEKGDRIQVISLNHSLRKCIANINARVNNMLDIVGDYSVNIFNKKLEREGNCLSCNTPADVQVTEKNMKLAKRLISRSRPIPFVIAEKATEKICIPGRPIPHAMDHRALVCDRYCGASITNTEGSLGTSMGLDAIDKDPTHKSDLQNRVHLTCTPCRYPL